MRLREPKHRKGKAYARTHLNTVLGTGHYRLVDARLPTGVATFLFTDVEGSTKLLHDLGDGYAAALPDDRRTLRGLCGCLRVQTTVTSAPRRTVPPLTTSA